MKMRPIILMEGMGVRISEGTALREARGGYPRPADLEPHHEGVTPSPHRSDGTFGMRGNRMEVHQNHADPSRVKLVDTCDNLRILEA